MEKEREIDFRTVERYNDPTLANIDRTYLEANGIPAGVFGEVSPYPCMGYAYGDIELKVNVSDYDAAKALIDAARSGANEVEESDEEK